MQPRAKAPKPRRIHSPRGARETTIHWNDGHTSVYPHALLRAYCPCAGCQGHSGSITPVDTSHLDLELDGIEPVGNYAVSLTWFDGHQGGIYAFEYLRRLCPCDVCASASD